MKRLKSIKTRVKYEDSYILLAISRKFEEHCEKIIIGNDNTVAEFLIYEHSPGYMGLVEILNKAAIKHTIRETRKYAEKELKEFEYFAMYLTAPWRKVSCSFGTEFESGAKYLCEENQVSELSIPTINAAKYPMCIANPGIVIRNDFLQLMIENSVTGYELGSVRDSRSKKHATNLNQLIVTKQLKPVSDCSIYETRKYEENEKKSIIFLSEIFYEEEVLIGACDFNFSQERYSYRIGSYLVDIPYFIVSRKLRDICKKNKIRTISFEPVHIIRSETPARKWNDKNVQNYYIGGSIFDDL